MTKTAASERAKVLHLFSRHGVMCILDEDDKEFVAWMGFDRSEIPKRVHKSRARRLIAAWNACARIETNDLEVLADGTIADVLITEGVIDTDPLKPSANKARADEATTLLKAILLELSDTDFANMASCNKARAWLDARKNQP